MVDPAGLGVRGTYMKTLRKEAIGRHKGASPYVDSRIMGSQPVCKLRLQEGSVRTRKEKKRQKESSSGKIKASEPFLDRRGLGYYRELLHAKKCPSYREIESYKKTGIRRREPASML